MGDWGGQSAAPFTTSDERSTAKSMKEQKATFNVSLSLALEDDFYDNGVKNAQDSRFQETFEKVFDPTLDNFRVLAGNRKRPLVFHLLEIVVLANLLCFQTTTTATSLPKWSIRRSPSAGTFLPSITPGMKRSTTELFCRFVSDAFLFLKVLLLNLF